LRRLTPQATALRRRRQAQPAIDVKLAWFFISSRQPSNVQWLAAYDWYFFIYGV
jgi:hypothetical protein